MRRRGLPSRVWAFTLPEVLATMVFLGVVLPVTLRAVTVSLQASARARHVLEATQLAQEKIGLALALRDVSELSGGGACAEPWSQYHWEMASSARSDGSYDVQVSVSWQEALETRSIELDTIVFPRADEDPSTEAAS